MAETVQEVRYMLPGGRKVTRVHDPDVVEQQTVEDDNGNKLATEWTRIVKDDRVVRVNGAVPVIIETQGES